MNCRLFGAAVCFFVAWVASASLDSTVVADVIRYVPPGSRSVIELEGKATKLPGRLISFRHDVATLAFSMDTCEVIEALTKQEQFHRLFNRGKAAKDMDMLMDAARFAIRGGLSNQLKECLKTAWEVDSTDERIRRLAQTYQEIHHGALSDPKEDEARFRETIDRSDMKVLCSRHYILLHDIADEKVPRGELSRPKQRLKLLETVYETYFLKFALEGYPLEQPKERLMVLLFGEEEGYMHYVTTLNPALCNASGFWTPANNVAVFYDQSTTESLKVLRELSNELLRAKRDVKATGNRLASRDFAQFANLIEALVTIQEFEADNEVVTHEATHQLAGNSGLLPRDMIFLRWAQEGLASYFETPSGSGWGGIGAVNAYRLDWYRLLDSETRISNVEFIVTDKIFDYARSDVGEVAAYGQAWALTHYMMENEFGNYMKFFGKIREIDPELNIQDKQTQVLEAFLATCGSASSLDASWRTYMRGLKTDIDRILENR